MKATRREIDVIVARLEATPRRISARTSGLGEAQLRFSPDKQTWSIAHIFAHLRSCADVWGLSIERMPAEDHPTLPYHHPHQWLKKTDYPKLEFLGSFQAYAEQRIQLLRVLENLSLDDRSRAAIIKNREHTVFTEARRMAKHEAEHCEQIEQLL